MKFTKHAKKSIKDEAEQRKTPKGMTKNGERIFNLMRDNKVKGNWKDWVLFVGDRMLDRYGTYTIALGENEIVQNHIFLAHKSKLSNILGEEFGSKFWDNKWKRRTNYGAPPAQRTK